MTTDEREQYLIDNDIPYERHGDAFKLEYRHPNNRDIYKLDVNDTGTMFYERDGVMWWGYPGRDW